MGQYLFAYGSFEESQIHHNKISQFITSEKNAFLKGEIYRLTCGFPMVDLESPTSLIEGKLYELDTPDSFWPVLDELLGVDITRLEKSLFQRRQAEVMIDNYTKALTQVYCLNPKKITKKFIKVSDGDWRKDMEREPTVVEQLEPHHKDYIVKLSKTRGRDIVPIKLDLYRELLSMELIVDKGRRLALTPLGKETSLFIQ